MGARISGVRPQFSTKRNLSPKANEARVFILVQGSFYGLAQKYN